MLTIARNLKTGKIDDEKHAISGNPYECIYCGVQLHFCRKGFYVRNDGQPEHKRGARCYDMVSRSTSSTVQHKIELTKKADFFSALESRKDNISDTNDWDLPFPDDPDDPDDPDVPHAPEISPKICPQLSEINIDPLWTAQLPSEAIPIIERVKDYNITQLNPGNFDLANLNIEEDDLSHLAAAVEKPNLLSKRDFEILTALVDCETKRVDAMPVRPIRTLKQFNDADIIFLPPGTRFADCQLKSIFISYYHSGFRETFLRNYKSLGKRILYCQAKPLTFKFKDDKRPYIQFWMFWSNEFDNGRKEYYSISLFLNFRADKQHTAKERFEYFVEQHFRMDISADGTQIWVPKNAKKKATAKQRFDALLFADWKCSEPEKVVETDTGDIKHSITLRADYINAKQLLFIDGYNG